MHPTRPWTYVVLTLAGKTFEQINRDLAGVGSDGWELAGVTEKYMFFKRPAGARSDASMPEIEQQASRPKTRGRR
jgi:hypothetical protein